VHQFNFAGSLAAPTEPAAAVLELRPPASNFVVAISRAALSPAEASTCGEKTIPASPSFFPSYAPRRRSPAAGCPPPLAPRLSRRLNLPCKHMLEFAHRSDYA
jgi:hypothetical protein